MKEYIVLSYILTYPLISLTDLLSKDKIRIEIIKGSFNLIEQKAFRVSSLNRFNELYFSFVWQENSSERLNFLTKNIDLIKIIFRENICRIIPVTQNIYNLIISEIEQNIIKQNINIKIEKGINLLNMIEAFND